MRDKKFSNLYYATTGIVQSSAYLQRMLALGLVLPAALLRASLKRQCEFLAGRYCARQVLQQAGILQQSILVGKFREPIWPKTIVGSISHCHSQAIAICAKTAHYKAIGIDIEHCIAPDVARQINHQVVGQEEEKLKGYFSDYNIFITSVFSAKEAIYKAIFPVVRQPVTFDDIQLNAIDKNGVMIFLLSRHLNKSFPLGYRLAVHPSWVGDNVQNLCTIPA